MRHDRCQQHDHRQRIRADLLFIKQRGGKQRIHRQVSDRPQDEAKGQPYAKEFDPLPGRQADRAGSASPQHKHQEHITLAGRADQAQPFQPIIENRNEQQQVSCKAHHARCHQRIPGFIMRTVRRGIALFHPAQLGRVELVIGHVHSLWPIPHQGADQVRHIRAAIRVVEWVVGAHQLPGALPDQDTHLAGAVFGIEHLAVAADQWRIPQAAQRPIGNAEQQQEHASRAGDPDRGQHHPALLPVQE